MATPYVTWIEVALVQPGQRQLTMNPLESEIGYVVDGGQPVVVVVYTDGSDRVYGRHEELPILADDVEYLARRGGDW
jgi:hypothetical protein